MFNLQMDTAGLLSPLALLSIKTERKNKISATIHHYQTLAFLSHLDML